MKSTKEMVDEDYEREWLKDSIYIGEYLSEEEEELWRWMAENEGFKIKGETINGTETRGNSKNKPSEIQRLSKIGI